MASVNNSGVATSDENVAVTKSLRKLYLVRTVFSFLWFILVAALAKKNACFADALLIIYPAWDAIAIYFDTRAHPITTSRTPQYVNAAISGITTVAVILALKKGVAEALMVFGAWAILAGFMQLILGLRRRKTLGGQWPMIVSGGQSMIAGTAFIVLAHSPSMGIDSLAGYAAFGGLYFLLSAIRLFKANKSRRTND